MSKYTTELRYICETHAGLTDSKGFNDIDTIIAAARPYIFNFSYPIFDDEYKEVLETKILRHYYTREIGLETYGLWKLKLETKMNEIMPYYNRLYKSELLSFDPLRDVDMQTTHVGTKTGTRTDVSNAEDSNERNANNVIDDTRVQSDERVNTFDGMRSSENQETTAGSSSTQGGHTTTNQNSYSDTPQGAITNVENGTYLTNYRKIADAGTESSATDSSGVSNVKGKVEDDNTETSKGQNTVAGKREESITGNDNRRTSSVTAGKTNNTEDYVMHVFGKSAGTSYSKLLKELRDTFLNIDMDIIRDLGDLFMLIW